MPKYAISLIGMKRPSGSRQCLETMIRHSQEQDCHFFVVSNGCPDTAKVFRDIAAKHKNVTVSENATNEGFQKPHNRHYVQAATMGCEFILVANDDISVPSGFLRTLSAPMEQDPTVAITGPEGNCTHLDSDFHGTQAEGPVEFIEMSCGMIRIAAIRSLRTHLWCPGLRFCYAEDSSLSLFVQEKGYRITTVPMHVDHLRSVTVNGDPETKRLCAESQAANHALNKVRWRHWIQHRRFDHPIILKRSYAIGDVLLITPIIRAIAQSNPLSPIYVQTNYPELFARNPHVASATVSQPDLHDALFIDLDGSYENQPMTHIVHAYERTTREKLPGLGPVDLRTEIFPAKEDMEWAEKTHKNMADDTPLVCFGMDETTWRGKNWPEERFHELRHRFHKEGWTTLAVGSRKPEVQTSFHQLAALLSKSKLFIGNDSFCLHAAQAAGCPVVAPFGPTRARFIFTQGSKAAGVDASTNIPCAGERHRTVGKTFVDCDASCINSITVDQMWAAIEKLGVL